MTRGGDPRERLLDQMVAAAVPRVLDEALEQAVRQAREELAARLARAIVDRALASPPSADSGPRTTNQGAVSQAPAESSDRPSGRTVNNTVNRRPAGHAPDEQGLYAFAIMPARPVDLAGVTGIDGEAPLHIVQYGDLGLVVSPMRLDLMDDISEDDLSETGLLAVLARRHDEVVRAVFEHGPVLPLRFGTVVADEAGAVRLLQEQDLVVRRRLAHLASNREWGVRLVRDQDAAQAAEQGATLDRRQLSGTSYLAARREALQRAQRAEEHSADLTERVRQALREHAADEMHRGGGPGSDVLADLAYLVPQSAEEAFLAAAERLIGEIAGEHLELAVTGPWPPYSFASLQEASSAGGVVGGA